MQDIFIWCKECLYYNDCYENGNPSYLEPECNEGPVKEDK